MKAVNYLKSVQMALNMQHNHTHTHTRFPPPDLGRVVQAGAVPDQDPVRGPGPDLRGPEAGLGRRSPDRHGPDRHLQGTRPGQDER